MTLDFVYYRDRHDQRFPWYNRTLNEVGPAIREQDYVTLKQLLIINQWKGLNKNTDRVLRNKPKEVIEKTRRAFSLRDDRNRIEALAPSNYYSRYKIHGVGVSVASTILTFWKPRSYGVIDRHASRCLYRNACDLKEIWGIESPFCEKNCRLRWIVFDRRLFRISESYQNLG